MRKWRLLSLALAVLALIAIPAAAVWVSAQGAPIRFEETILSGDAADFAGLSIRSAYDCGGLRWDTVYTPGTPEAETTTRYVYSLFDRTDSAEPEHFDVLLLWDGMEYASRGDETDAAAQRLFDEVASRAPAGASEYTETLNAEDWFDAIPLVVQVHAEGWDAQAVESAVKEAISIPLEGDVPLDVTIYKGADGKFSHAVLGARGGAPEIFTVSAIGQDAIWFALNAPNGAALYQLTKDLQVNTLLPATETAEASNLFLTEDGKRLVLLGKNLGEAALRVLDAKSGETLQSLPLPIGEDVSWDAMRQDDHLLLNTSDGQFLLLEALADGSYAVALTGSRAGTAMEGMQSFVWNGERLAVVSRSADRWLNLTVSVFFRDGKQSTLTAQCSLTSREKASPFFHSITPTGSTSAEISESQNQFPVTN